MTMESIADQLAQGSGREHDVAEWTIAADVCKRLDDYEPGTFKPAHALGWTTDDMAAVQSLLARGRMNFDDTSQAVLAFPLPFGKWREMVTTFEELESRKLRGLWWAFQVFERLGKLPDAKVDQINNFQLRIWDCLRIRWNMRPETMPTTLREVYPWASKASRRYDLCPKVWRFV
jgi:hypothetical protein